MSVVSGDYEGGNPIGAFMTFLGVIVTMAVIAFAALSVLAGAQELQQAQPKTDIRFVEGDASIAEKAGELVGKTIGGVTIEAVEEAQESDEDTCRFDYVRRIAYAISPDGERYLRICQAPDDGLDSGNKPLIFAEFDMATDKLLHITRIRADWGWPTAFNYFIPKYFGYKFQIPPEANVPPDAAQNLRIESPQDFISYDKIPMSHMPAIIQDDAPQK